MRDTVHQLAVSADRAPSLQTWLPCAEVHNFLPWVCRFLTDRGENILVPDGPGGAILIFDAPHSITGEGIVHVSLEDVLDRWDSMLQQVAYDHIAFVIRAKDGTGAVLTRWECSPAPAAMQLQ